MSRYLAYQAHEMLVAPARNTAQVWRLVLGLVLLAGVYLQCNRILFRMLVTIQGEDAFTFFNVVYAGETPFAMYILLFSFGFMTLGVVVALKVAHKRGVLPLFGNIPQALSQFRDVLTVLLLVNAAVFLLPPWGMGTPLVSNMSFTSWTLLLPISLLAIFVQVSAEEILFRGYIQQQLAARFASPLVWMAFPAVVFGMGHYVPTEAGSNATLIALWAVLFGILMADLTARAGTLGPAIAVHFVNNVTAILIISLPDDLSGLALYLTPFSISDVDALRAWLPVDFLFMIVSWLAARLAIRR